MTLGDEMTVRRAVLSDAPAIALVHVRSWQATYRGMIADEVLDNLSVEASTRSWEGTIDTVWVGLVDDEVVAFASAGPSRDEDAAFELYAIYALPSAWGTGLGHSLMKAALDGEPDVIVWVLEENRRARDFYERQGFRPDGVTKIQHVGQAELNEVRYRTTG